MERTKMSKEKIDWNKVTFSCNKCNYLSKGRICKNCGSEDTLEYAGILHLSKVLELSEEGKVIK